MPQLEDCRLIPLVKRNLPTVLKWRNSEHVRANMFTDHIISWKEHSSWYENLKRKKDSSYLVFHYKNQPVGMVYFTNIEKRNNTCFWGFYIGAEDVPRGVGSAMGYLGLEYAFGKLRIRKICGEVLAFNALSLNFFKKIGFSVEGRFSEHVLKNNTFTDVIFFSLFRQDWDQKKDNLKASIFQSPGNS